MSGALPGDDCGRDWIWDREVETASHDQQVALADQAWKEQAATLAKRSAFHAERLPNLSAIGSVRDLHLLPTMAKADTRRALEDDPPFGTNLGAAPADVKRVFQTSGSSGRPSVIALTANDVGAWSVIGSRSYYATGIHAHHSVLTTFGAGPFVAGATHATLDKIGVRRVPVGPGDLERVLAAMESGLVDTLLATPSFALYLASVFDERGIAGSELGVQHLVVGGEPGGGIPAVRNRIENAFAAHLTEAAGIGDVSPSLYGECPAQDGMHFCGQGLVWPELVDPDTEASIAIEAGAVGEIVYTALVREAMPVVRFRSGDIVEITDTSCSCERTSFKVRILGRSDDTFIVRGVNVYPAAIQSVIAEFEPRVTGRSRVVLPEEAGVSVEPPIPVEVEVLDDAVIEADLGGKIEAALRSRLVFRAAITFVSRSDFGDADYKTRPVIRRPDNQGGA
ncbi:MAG: phenylacetate--CoA ligase family protein [Acidimicrobiia bacterium]|nr:phenylacetate--CoA ligase family protein [Acidimicrobiia bacterium]